MGKPLSRGLPALYGRAAPTLDHSALHTNLIERLRREQHRRLNTAGTIYSENELWKLTAATSIHQEQRWQKPKTYTVKELEQAA